MSAADPLVLAGAFVKTVKEDPSHNQYWYSAPTISRILAAVAEPLDADTDAPPRCAFLSTPSLFFSLPAAQRAGHCVLDFDAAQFAGPGGAAFCQYDFNAAPAGEFLPLALHGAFDVVVVDPPFITEAVWRRYAEAACVLLRGDGRGRAICTTVAENLPLLRELFPGMERTNFQPSIPHLVYQYDLFANADFAAFREANAELS